MGRWILHHAAILSTAASFLTLFVWLFYAQLLYYSFRRQRQAHVLINQGRGRGMNSVCLVSNMSHEPVYVQCLLITLHNAEDQCTSSITDLPSDRDNDDANLADQIVTRQGPLGCAAFMMVGTFQELVVKAARDNDWIDHDARDLDHFPLTAVDITAIINYGPDGKSLGFERSFVVQADGANIRRLHPRTVATRRLKNRDARHRMRYWLQRVG